MWVNSQSTSSHTEYFFLRVHSVSWAERNHPHESAFALFPSLFLSSLLLCLSGQLNSCLHPLFHGAFTVAGTVMLRQGLSLK